MSSEANLTEIKKDRLIKQNPYAHVDGNGKLSALAPNAVYVEASSNDISNDRKILENPYAHDYGNEGFSALKKLNNSALLQADKFIAKPSSYYSDEEIEGLAKSIQIELWRIRKSLKNNPSSPIELLNPEVAIEALGFDFDLVETLGRVQHSGKSWEVAGTIYKKTKQVQISRQFPAEVRRFTAAHELGHAIMHAGNGLHRDRPINGSPISGRSSTEVQADKFASYFLMPSKLLRKVFRELFLTEQFVVTEDTAFALGHGYKFLKSLPKRELARLLAKAEKYNFKSFKSLAGYFGVSEETMAIRLEELNLIA
jgi:Zn-dependent peptidase ImmA (M78 family)